MSGVHRFRFSTHLPRRLPPFCVSAPVGAIKYESPIRGSFRAYNLNGGMRVGRFCLPIVESPVLKAEFI